MYECFVTTKHHKLGDLQQQTVMFSQPWRPEVQDHFLGLGSLRRILPATSWWLQGSLVLSGGYIALCV